MRPDPTRCWPDSFVANLLDRLTTERKLRRPLLVGIGGLQASGKTTLSAQLVALAKAGGVEAVAFSLDDFYLGRAARARLARDVHPLFATRGPPGTHDIDGLIATLAALRAGKPVAIPRFDKGRDTRLPPSRWKTPLRPPRLAILEGWCVGVPPLPVRSLARPVNALERDLDPDATWRRAIAAALRGPYADAWRLLDRLVVVQGPSFDVVSRWRDEAERPLRARGAPRAMSPAALKRFLAHYQRLSEHALRTWPRVADIHVRVDEKRRVVG